MINNRSNSWKVDFNELELLLQRFDKCFNPTEPLNKNDIAYTFRVCIGSKVLDIVKTLKVGKIKEYGGSFSSTKMTPLKVQFSIGDLTNENREKLISLPVMLFDGRIDTSDGVSYFNKLKEFIIKQYGFIMINEE